MVRFSPSIAPALLFLVAISFLSGCGPMNGYVMNDSGQQYYKMGDYEMARKDFHKAMMDNPLDANYAHNYATASHKLGDAESAERVYRHALNIDPAHQPSYHGLAKLLMEQKRPDEARELLSTWVGTQPYVPESHVELAWFERKQGNYDEAEQALQNALRVEPNHHQAMAQLGQVYEDRGEPGQAISIYQNALAMKKSQPLIKDRLAKLNAEPMPTQITQRHRTYPPIRTHNLQYNDSPTRRLASPQPLVRNATTQPFHQSYPNPTHSGLQQVGYTQPNNAHQNRLGNRSTIFSGQPSNSSGRPGNHSMIQRGLQPTVHPISVTLGTPTSNPNVLSTNPTAIPVVSAPRPVVAPF